MSECGRGGGRWEPAPDTVAAFAVPQQAATTFHAPAITLAVKIMMAGFISDAAHRMATEAKRAQNAAGEHQLQKPTYISRLLRRRRGSLPPCAAEAGGTLGVVGLKTFRAAVAARYGAQKQAAD